jgi:hypothetical protein
MRFNKVAQMIGHGDAFDVAARLDFRSNIARHVVRLVFDGVESHDT